MRAFALASSATEAEVASADGAELARAAPGGSPVGIFRLSPFLGPRRRFKPAAPWRRHAQRHSYNSFLAIPNSFETAAKASPDSKRLTTSSLNAVGNKRTSNSKSTKFLGFANQQKSDSGLGCSSCPPFLPA